VAFGYDEFELVESAYRHGFDDLDFAQITHRRHLVIRNRRGRMEGYEILGRNDAGDYLIAAARMIESGNLKLLRVYHLGRMKESERRRFRRRSGQ
jgi:hypothetical protein